MKTKISIYLLIVTSFFLSACSSLDSDAKKAAELSKKSIEYTTQMKFDKAEQAYKQAQDYFRKYDASGQKEAFDKAYNEYLKDLY